jgi:hypothetical protein
MIIDNSISFFAVYYHNCIFHLNLSKEFAEIYSKEKYQNVILCQKDDKGGYLLTQSILSKDSEKPYLESSYYLSKDALKQGFNKLSNKIASAEKTFSLLQSSDRFDMEDTEKMIRLWKKEVKSATK